MNAEQIARVCHEVNRAYCRSIGDDTQVPWSDAPPDIKASAISGVESQLKKPLTPEERWAEWAAYKRGQGWKYGPTKNAATKEHPDLVGSYAEVNVSAKPKDFIFNAVVDSLKS